jgi:nitrogen fixation NifU-like protein
MTFDLRDLYSDILLDHSRSPRNRRELPAPPAAFVEGDNPLCGDRVKFFVRVRDGVVEDASYTGAGCAISLASASLACDAVRGKRADEADAIARSFIEHFTAETPSDLPGDLAALSNVRTLPMRVKCATLAWRAMREAIQEARGAQP